MSDIKPVIAHHPYQAQREDEISFEKDEHIQVVNHSDPDWWVGKKKDGTSGYFPSNFVGLEKQEASQETLQPCTPKEENLQDDKQEKEAIGTENILKEEENIKSEENFQEEEKEPVKVDHVIGMARVMEDYAMQESGEISLHRGGTVNVYEVIDDHWARGELNGKVGRYPIEFVEDIDMPDLGRHAVPQKTDEEQPAGPKSGFKLAAFGVKQGGIGSLFAGGLPGLKKTAVKHEELPEESNLSPKEPEEPTLTAPPVPQVPQQKPAQESIPKALIKAIVLHPYDADGEDEINLLRGEYVDVVDRHVDEGWWKGTNEKGETGVFPSNFVKELEQDIVAPPTPVRSRPSNSSGARPVSVQSSTTARPISIQSPVPRPSTVQVLSSGAAVAVPPKPPTISFKENNEQEGTQVQEKEEEEGHIEAVQENTKETQSDECVANKHVEDAGIVCVEPEKSGFVEETQTSPSVPTRSDEINLNSDEKNESTVVKEEKHAPPVVPERQASVESITSNKQEVPHILKQEDSINTGVTEKTENISSENEARETEKNDEKTASSPVHENESIEKEDKNQSTEGDDNEKDEEKRNYEEEEKKEEGLEDIPSGPKLTAPVRARIGGARRPRQTKSNEPSQTEILQKEVSQAPEEERKVAPSPPAKPVKPIFAKFPTPFSVGAEDLTKRTLKPTQTRKPWEEEKTVESEEQDEPARPVGVRNIASRFNVPSSGNEVIETKLKNHTKNEVEKVKKEFLQLLQQEKERTSQLESLVQDLMERVKELEK